MAYEGTLWFSNLTIADPTLIIPFAVGIFNLANIEVSVNQIIKCNNCMYNHVHAFYNMLSFIISIRILVWTEAAVGPLICTKGFLIFFNKQSNKVPYM